MTQDTRNLSGAYSWYTCRGCGHPVRRRALPSDNCPECGGPYAQAGIKELEAMSDE